VSPLPPRTVASSILMDLPEEAQIIAPAGHSGNCRNLGQGSLLLRNSDKQSCGVHPYEAGLVLRRVGCRSHRDPLRRRSPCLPASCTTGDARKVFKTFPRVPCRVQGRGPCSHNATLQALHVEPPATKYNPPKIFNFQRDRRCKHLHLHGVRLNSLTRRAVGASTLTFSFS